MDNGLKAESATAKRFMRRLAQRRARVKLTAVPDLRSTLEQLELPRMLPGDELHFKSADERPARWYTPDGEPIRGTTIEQVLTQRRYRCAPENHLMSRPFYRSGMRIWVSTVYLGLDHDFFNLGLPIVWETMVFGGATYGEELGQWRYATRAAAYAGHRQVVAAVAGAQRAHRAASRVCAPRRLAVAS